MEKAHSKSGLFLLEIVIIILFLAFASVLCARVFMGARDRSADAGELSMAETLAGGAADIIRGSDQDPSVNLSDYYPEGVQTEDGMNLYYDRNWKPCDRKDFVYRMEIAVSEEESGRVGRIRVFDARQDEIYSLKAVVHVRSKAGAGNGGV